MKEYNKINTIYKRDINNIIMPYSGFVKPELEWLKDCKFEATEKIDGTNTSIQLVPEVQDVVVINGMAGDYIERTVTYHIEYHGKTDRAQIPTKLLLHLQQNYTEELMLSVFNLTKTRTFKVTDEKVNETYPTYIVYGEGYGAGIQKGGNYISKDVSFIVFDVQVGDWYLLRDDMLNVAAKMNAPTVPYFGKMTIDEAIKVVRNSFISTISENRQYKAEGLVLKSPYGCRFRNGERVIFKVKTCDWEKYYNKYHTFDPVEQTPNPKFKPEE